MIIKAVKVPLNQNGGRISVWYLELKTEHPPTAPTQLSKHLIFRSDELSYCALGAAAIRIRFSHLSFDLEECWAKLAQLFTFYWALTRNKFSFSPNFVVTRSPLFNPNLCGRHIGISGKNRFGDHLEYRSNLERSSEEQWKDRKLLGMEQSAISPTFE